MLPYSPTPPTPRPITHAPSPLVTPEHILHIENRLRLRERQIYITLDPDTIILHADRRRTEAIELRTKLNNELSALEASCPSPESRHTIIRALQYTDCNALLIEFDTPDSVKAFCSYCTSSNFQSHISPAAKTLPRVFHIIMKFVPCDGSFDPKDENQLRIIEKDHDLEEGSIISADWIKKPSWRTPNQKTAHIRFLCASPTIANKLLSSHIFLTNALICVQKDPKNQYAAINVKNTATSGTAAQTLNVAPPVPLSTLLQIVYTLSSAAVSHVAPTPTMPVPIVINVPNS